MRLGGTGCALGATVCFIAIATVAHAAIGTAVSVAPSATNSRGGASRPLAAQDPLEQNDRIRTSGEGAVQTRFNDDTILIIGPNSEVVLDRYLYDGSVTRNITVQVVRGAMRFVSGKSASDVYQIKTPVATIGVRGTVVNILFEGGRLITETPSGLSTICLTGTTNCRELAAGGAALSIGVGGFSPASASDTARMNRQLQLAQTQLAQQGGGQQGGTGKGSGNSNLSETSDVLNTSPPVVPAVTFIANAVNSGPPSGPGPAFPDFTTVFRFTGRSATPFEHITSTFESNNNCFINCANFLYASRASAKWDIGTDALRSVTLAVTPNPANDPNPTTVTRGTAKVVDLFTGTGNVPGYGVVPIYQMVTWADGTLLYSQVGGPSGTVTFGPNEALSIIGWGYTGSLFQTPLTFGRTVQFSLEHASPASWTDGRSPFGTFSGTAAVSIAASGLSFGLNATVNMTEGTFTIVTPGGTAAPWLSGIVGHRDGRFSASGITPVGGPASFCTSGCVAELEFDVIFNNRIALNYGIANGSIFNNNPEVIGTAAFTAGASSSTPLATRVSFAGVYPISPGNTGASGILEEDLSFGATDNLVLRQVDLVTGEKRIRDTARVTDRGSVPGIIAWERWTDGNVKNESNTVIALSANQGLHFVTGTPATNIPTGGTYIYNAIGGTKPTITDGSVAPGTLDPNSRVAITFAPLITNSRVGLDLNVGIGGSNYNILTAGGISNPNLSGIGITATGGFSGSAIPVTYTGAGIACPSICTASVDGFIAGNFASHVGIVYQFGSAGFPNQMVTGAGGFGRPIP